MPCPIFTLFPYTTLFRSSALAVSITVFWASMTIGRLCMTFIIDRIGYSKLFVICCFGQLFSFGLFAVSPNVYVSFAAIFLSGLLMVGIFSIALLIVKIGRASCREGCYSLV